MPYRDSTIIRKPEASQKQPSALAKSILGGALGLKCIVICFLLHASFSFTFFTHFI